MKYEDSVYGKLGLSMTRGQIKKWNKIQMEMWAIADFLCDRYRIDGLYEKASRLKDLIGQFPIFEDDGKGFIQSGNAIPADGFSRYGNAIESDGCAVRMKRRK